ncbi:MAG: NAD(P)H-dependent oxidoreductase [Faecousia sp.]
MKTLLFLNACYNRETSRTLRIGKELISLLMAGGDYKLEEIVLEKEQIAPLTSETLNLRFELLAKKAYENPMFAYADQFRNADCIVIAAPYWDFGFPSVLKTYIEAIGVAGFVYHYGPDGRPEGLCKADKLYYVTTRGGFIPDDKDLGYATIVDMGHYYGINEITCISAMGLDVPVTNVEETISKTIRDLPNKL